VAQVSVGRNHPFGAIGTPDAPRRTGFGSAGVLEVVEDHRGDTYRAFYTVVKFAAPQRPPKMLLKERAAPLRARSNASPTSRATLFGSSFPLEESRRGNDRPAARGGVARLAGPFGRSYQRRSFRESSKYWIWNKYKTVACAALVAW